MAEPLDQLLGRCRRGEDDAVAALVERFAHHVLDLATALLEDQHLAEDAMQGAFVTALARLDQLRTPAAFPGWLLQIVRTEANRILRSRRERVGEVPGSQVAAEPSPSEEAELGEQTRRVRQAVAALPPATREAARLFYLDEMKCHQIAERLDIPPGTVKRRLYDARRLLHGMLLGRIAPDPSHGDQRRGGTGLPL
ncbi:MAG: sigma-70 family RNA polymerase sigma factor [Phycisphaeraceae bacterium]|nr:sigma-70 family RNA polymerase sigma factor [Phycisphaeraceae bacterium]